MTNKLFPQPLKVYAGVESVAPYIEIRYTTGNQNQEPDQGAVCTKQMTVSSDTSHERNKTIIPNCFWPAPVVGVCPLCKNSVKASLNAEYDFSAVRIRLLPRY